MAKNKSLIDQRRLERDVRRMSKALDKIGREVVSQVNKTIAEEVEQLLIEAKELAPVETGRLRDSGRLVKRKGPSGVMYEIVFGGVTRKGKFVDYAVAVHELHRTKSQYLQKAVAKRVPGLPDKIAKKVKLKGR